MDSRQLGYFCAVLKLGSFTKAAEACSISQSAISQQIRALETDLGCELLVRNGRHFKPTPAGTLLARKGTAVLGQLSDLEAEVLDVASGRPRHLSVGYLNRYDGWEVAAAVAAFARRHPGCEVKAESGTHDGLYHLVLDGRLDIIFNDRRRSLSGEWENVHLLTCFRYAEVSEVSDFAWNDAITCESLASLPCILVCEPDQRETEIRWWRDIMHFDGDFLFASGTDEARMMVAGNRGWMPLEAREQTARVGSVIRRIPLHDASGHSQSDYYAFWPKERSNPLIAEFASVLKGLF